jgi:hypothetical protein
MYCVMYAYRCAEILMKEKSYRVQGESVEVELRNKLNFYESNYYAMETELKHIQNQNLLDRTSFQREKEDLIRIHDANMKKLMSDKEALVSKMLEESSQRISEMNSKFDNTVKDMEQTVRHNVIKEMNNEKMMSMSAVERKYAKLMDEVRAEERRNAQIEIDKIRKTYAQREQQTVQDLQLLEELHASKVNALEREVLHFQQRSENIERLYEQSKMVEANEAEKIRKQSEYTLHMSEDMGNRMKELEGSLHQALSELQESRIVESKYRSKLSEALEENRIQRAQYLDLQKQCDIDSATVHVWKNATHESKVSLSSYETCLRIAQEEIVMLENEIKRIQDENLRLKSALTYADKIVYGKSASSVATTSEVGVSKSRKSSFAGSAISTPINRDKSINVSVRSISPSPWKPPAGFSNSKRFHRSSDDFHIRTPELY